MFYVKARLEEGTPVEVDIDTDNVFCRCPRCGKEVQVDLTGLIKDEDFDLIGSVVLCKECSSRIREVQRR